MLFSSGFKFFYQALQPKPRIFMDISTIVRADGKTGIHRVVRSILKYCLTTPFNPYRIEATYFDQNGNYFHAKKWVAGLLNQPTLCTDRLVVFKQNDIMLYLDFFHDIDYFKEQIEKLSERHIKIYCVIYDLLPLQHPEWFIKALHQDFKLWMQTIFRHATGLICISKTIAQEVRGLFEKSNIQRESNLKIGYFHLGADIENSVPSKSTTIQNQSLLKIFNERPTFLLVSCIAPRKGHQQTLAAFEKLWQEGMDINLVFVGVAYADLLRPWIDGFSSHIEFNKRFFWLEHMTDDLLIKFYHASTAMLLASEAEGFGIPLIEAARYQVPIIARDIPIFKEIAGEHAFYFTGVTADALATAIKEWLALYQQKKVPDSTHIRWQTWAGAGERLLTIIHKDDWYYISKQSNVQLIT